MAKRRKMKVEEQMDMLEGGGLLDEGGSVDPVSGNDVPSGSTQEEVRDDIPAQLSEGEFVFPADVVRYIGLENLMQLRQKAKAGLQKMEDMGQMGNAEEAIMDDDGAYKDEVGSMIDNLELAQGGMVPQQNIPPIGPPVGNTMPGQVAPPMPTNSAFQMQPSTAMNQTTRPNLAMAQGGMLGQAPNPLKKRRRTPFKKPTQNFQAGGMPQPVPTFTPPTQVPTYAQFMGQTTPGQGPASPVVYGTDQYIGPNGDIIGITTINGNPIQDIPAGYKKYNPATDMPAQPEVAQPVVQEEDRGSDDRDNEDTRSQLEKDMARTEPKTRDVAQQAIDNATDPDVKNQLQEQLDKLNKSVDLAYAAPVAAMIPGVGTAVAGKLVRDAIKEDNAMDAMIKDVTGLSTRQYRDEQLTRAADEGLGDTVRESMEDMFGSDYLDRQELDDLASKTEQERIDSFNDIVTRAGRSDLAIGDDDKGISVEVSSGDGRPGQDDIDAQGAAAADAGLGNNEDDDDTASNPAGDVDSGPGSGFGYAKGGAVKQTKKKGLGRLKTTK